MEKHPIVLATSLGNIKKPSKQFGTGRRCNKWGCQTILSRYNSEEFCSVHIPSYVGS